MIQVFSEKEKAAARKQRTIMLSLWFVALFLVLAIVITFIVVDTYLVAQLRNRDNTLWMGIVAGALMVLFGCGSLFFFAIKFRLTRKYVRMLKDMDRGLKDEIVAKFVGYDETITMKDGVYFYSMILDAQPLKREDITERKVLVEQTLPKMDINEGSKLKIVSHANILVAYEILQLAPKKEEPQSENSDSVEFIKVTEENKVAKKSDKTKNL